MDPLISRCTTQTAGKKLVQFLCVERWPEEPFEVFNRRRFRLAACFADRHGDWGTEHANRLCSWAAYLQRARNSASLAAMFFAWHTPEWLQARRDNPDIGGSSRPGTRTCSGHVSARLDESIPKGRRLVARQHDAGGPQ